MKDFFKKSVTTLLYILVFVLLLDPTDKIFHLKIILFSVIFFLWLFEKVVANSISTKRESFVFIIIYFLIPIIGIFSAFLQNNFDDKNFALGFLKSVSVLLLLFIIDDYKVRIDQILIRTSIVIPCLTLFAFTFFFLNPDYFISYAAILFSPDLGSAAFAFRNYYGFEITMFFFKTSPLLIFPLGYYCYRLMKGKIKLGSLLLVVLYLSTMILSGTRANILAAFLVVVIIVFNSLIVKRNKLPLFISSSFVIYLLIVLLSKASFSENDVSQQVKAEHIDSYMKLFDENPQYLIWGQGLGSKFYSKGFSAYVPQSELTYVDIIRMFGLPLGLVFIFFTFYPLVNLCYLFKRNKEIFYLIVTYTAYLFIAGTNPLLISSTGMLAILAVFSTIRHVSSCSSFNSVKQS